MPKIIAVFKLTISSTSTKKAITNNNPFNLISKLRCCSG